MLSVLIPVYNHHISSLVHEIHSQLSQLKVPFEICCMDDHSEHYFTQKNQNILFLPNTFYCISGINKGRERTRQLLSERASFENLLFLDADTLPVHADFINIYLEHINSDCEAVFGGIAYETAIPPQEVLLRWTYGTRYESRKASERNKHPYRSITSPNFMIRKTVFQSINSQISGKEYGYDLYFAKLMREKNIKILHIDNEVFHLGIENNETYLRKSEEALRTYLNLLRTEAIHSKDSKLMATFVTLKSLKLNYVLYGFYNVFGEAMKKNLLGKNPSVRLFQLYRLSYICYADIALN